MIVGLKIAACGSDMEPAMVFDPLHLHRLGFHFLHNGQKRLQVRQQNRSQGCDCVIVGAVEKIEAAFEYLRVSPLGAAGDAGGTRSAGPE